MTINVNNQIHTISENISLKTLLTELEVITSGIAIAINNEVIVKESWNNTFLQQEDQVTIIQATQGG